MLTLAPAWAINGSGTLTANSTVLSGAGATITGTYTASDSSTGTYRLTLLSTQGYSGQTATVANGGIYVRNAQGTTLSGNDSLAFRLDVTPSVAGTQLTLELVQGGLSDGGNNEASLITISPSAGGVSSVALNPLVTLHPTNGPTPAGSSTPQIRQPGTSPVPYDQPLATYDADYPALSVGTVTSTFQTLGVFNSGSGYRLDTSFPGTATLSGGTVSMTVTYVYNLGGNSFQGPVVGESFNEWVGFGIRATRATNLTITKTSSPEGPLPAGSTVTYAIVAANGGPMSAPNAIVRDTPSTGLNCTQVSCSATAGAVCPAPYNPGPAPFNAGAGSLGNASGVQLPTFPAGSSVTFSVECDVTATGL